MNYERKYMNKEYNLLELATMSETFDEVEGVLGGFMGIGHKNETEEEYVHSVLSYAEKLTNNTFFDLCAPYKREMDRCACTKEYMTPILEVAFEEVKSLRHYNKRFLEQLARQDWENCQLIFNETNLNLTE